MPSAARLVAAVCLACLAGTLSVQIAPLFEGAAAGLSFVLINMMAAAATGWKMMGPRAGQGWSASVSNGLGGGLVALIWALFLHAALQMTKKAMAGWYKSPGDALVAIFDLMIEFGQVITGPPVMAHFVLGSVLSGLICEYTARKWP